MTYRWREVVPAMGFQAPFPFRRHLHCSNRLDVTLDLLLRQFKGARPNRVERATHVADFMDPALKWGDPAVGNMPKRQS